MFVALQPCVNGFRMGCWPYLGIDSTYLTTKYLGQLAAATSINGHKRQLQLFQHRRVVLDLLGGARWGWLPPDAHLWLERKEAHPHLLQGAKGDLFCDVGTMNNMLKPWVYFSVLPFFSCYWNHVFWNLRTMYVLISCYWNHVLVLVLHINFHFCCVGTGIIIEFCGLQQTAIMLLK